MYQPQGGSDWGMVRAMFTAMMIVAVLIIQYMVAAPVYFMLVDQLYAQAVAQVTSPGGASLLPSIYGIAKYAYPTITVGAIIAVTVWLYLYARRRYYASAGVTLI